MLRDAGSRVDGEPPWAAFDATAMGPPYDAGPQFPSGALLTGFGQLSGFYVAEAGYLLVLSHEVRLVDRDGTERARWESPYRITASAFDGELLGIADSARLTGLRAGDLAEVSRSTLHRNCWSAAMLGGHRLVCTGDRREFELVFSVYDLMSGGELGRSEPVPDAVGTRIAAVTGHDAFVTVGAGEFPSHRFELFRVTSEGPWIVEHHALFDTGESGAQFALVGDPATHVVNDLGRLLRFDGCERFNLECFVRDGSIGTFGVRERVLAIDELTTDSVVALTAAHEPGGMQCALGCGVQRADVASRAVLADGVFDGPVRSVLAARYDRWTDSVAVAAHATCPSSSCEDWSISRVALEAR
ncbi:MAG: hypothetical protein M3Y87_07645 [Myxococcota bacterium]|nr:hypothetical protein [Myxococcota bacterium]